MTIAFSKSSLVDHHRVIMTEEYRGYQISIATCQFGDKPDIRVYTRGGGEKFDNDVTSEFSCYQMTEIDGSFDNVRIIMNEIDERENKVGVKIKRMDALPPGSNPFDYDMDRQGIQANEFIVMWSYHCPHELIVIHVATGVRVKVDCSTLKEYHNCMKTECTTSTSKRMDMVLVCTECAPHHKNPGMFNWRSKDICGQIHTYSLLESEMHARGILSCDICGQ